MARIGTSPSNGEHPRIDQGEARAVDKKTVQETHDVAPKSGDEELVRAADPATSSGRSRVSRSRAGPTEGLPSASLSPSYGAPTDGRKFDRTADDGGIRVSRDRAESNRAAPAAVGAADLPGAVDQDTQVAALDPGHIPEKPDDRPHADIPADSNEGDGLESGPYARDRDNQDGAPGSTTIEDRKRELERELEREIEKVKEREKQRESGGSDNDRETKDPTTDPDYSDKISNKDTPSAGTKPDEKQESGNSNAERDDRDTKDPTDDPGYSDNISDKDTPSW